MVGPALGALVGALGEVEGGLAVQEVVARGALGELCTEQAVTSILLTFLAKDKEVSDQVRGARGFSRIAGNCLV